MPCFLCEINSEAEPSEEENESAWSLQQEEDGEERPNFKNNISFLFFSSNTACSSKNTQAPTAPSPQLFLGPQCPGRKKWCSWLCLRLSAVVDCTDGDYLPHAASFRPEGRLSQ